MHGHACERVVGCRVAGQLSGSTQLFGVVGAVVPSSSTPAWRTAPASSRRASTSSLVWRLDFSDFVAALLLPVRQPVLDVQRVSTPVISVFSRRHRRRPAARLDGVAGCCRRPMPSSLAWRLHHQRARVQHHGDMDERRIDGRMQSVKRKERE